MEEILKPILYLIWMTGIDIPQKFPLLFTIIFAVLFHAISLLSITKNVACYNRKLSVTFIFSEVFKVANFISWFILWARRRKVKKLLADIRYFQEEMAFKSAKKYHRFTKCIAFAFVSCGIIVIVWHGIDIYSEKSKNSVNCDWFEAVGFDFVEMAVSFVSKVYLRSVIAFFLSLCCILITVSIKFDYNSQFDPLRIYMSVFRVVRNLNETTSPILLIILMQLILMTFRIVASICENFYADHFKGIQEMYVILDLILCFISVTVLILSYDALQAKINKIRRYILENSELSFKMAGLYIRIIEDKEILKPTAWGMFEVKKSLLLTFGTSVITYGYLIYQWFSYK